jgi:hypothetical protein
MPHFVHTIRGPNSVSGILIDVEDHLVPAAVAHDVERPHAVLAHVREVHRLDFVLEPVGHGFTTPLPAPGIIVGLSGFLIFSQSVDRPIGGRGEPLETMSSRPMRHAAEAQGSVLVGVVTEDDADAPPAPAASPARGIVIR